MERATHNIEGFTKFESPLIGTLTYVVEVQFRDQIAWSEINVQYYVSQASVKYKEE